MSQGSAKGLPTVENSNSKDVVPKSSDLNSIKGNRNFIKENQNKMIYEEHVQKKKTTSAADLPNHKSFGKVPKYL